MRPGRLRYWYASSMANRIMVAAMSLSMTVVLAVGGTAYLSLSAELDALVSNRLDVAANLARQRLQDELDQQYRNIDDLALRSLVTQALVDATGRNGYLRPFLLEQQQASPEMRELGLYDWTGSALVSNLAHPPARPGLVAEAVWEKKTLAKILFESGGAVLMLGAPVRSPASAAVEGVLVGEINLYALADKVFKSSAGHVYVTWSDGQSLYPAAARLGSDTLRRQVPLAGRLSEFGLGVVAVLPRSEALAPLRQLQKTFLVMIVLASLVTFWGARLLARRITDPLGRLATHAQEIASDGAAGLRELHESGHDEIGWTAMAFNAMVRSLKNAYGELEDRVRDRTRELERRELYLRAILDNFPFMIWLKDEESRFLAVNSVMARNCGQASPEAMVGLSDDDIWPRELAASYRADDVAVMAERKERVVERAVAEGGRQVWYETFKKPVVNAGGEVLGTVGFSRDISERKQAEEAMRLRDRAIMATSDGIVITDMIQPQQPIIFVNPAFETISGYTREEVLGSNCRFLQGDEHDQAALDTVRRAIRDGRECRVVLRNYRKDGKPFWNELTLSPVRDEGGRITHYVGVQHDISDSLDALNALAASELRLKLAMGALRDGLWDWNIQTGTVYQSPSWAALLGYAPEELTGNIDSYERCLPNDEKRRVFAEIQEHLDGKSEDYACDHRMTRKDGSEIWVSDRGRVVERDPEGKPLRMVGTISDITERMRAEEEIMSWMLRVDTIMTLSPDAFIYLDTGSSENQVASVNLAFERMTGLLSGDVSNKPMRELVQRLQALADPKQPFPDLVALLHEECAAPLESPQFAKRQGIPQHIHLVKPAKRILAFDLRVSANRDSCVLYMRDVTRETEVDQMKSEFLSTAAHELRTPMASIMGFSELLLHRNYKPEAVRDMLETIYRQSRRLTDLLNELLDLARIEARAGRDFNYAVQSLEGVVRDSVAALSGREEDIRVAIDPHLPRVRIDAAKMQQALLNVIGNAFKYSPQGGEVEVRGYTVDIGGQVQICLSVRDHGIGMTQEQVERVFERFYRADPSGNIPGTGLGMSVVKEIMEIHGGGVYVSSEFGLGTTVTLWLPVAG